MKRQRRTIHAAGFTLLELVIAIGILLVMVSLVGSYMFTELRAHQATEDSLKLNRLATQVAERLAAQGTKANVTGTITVGYNGELISFGASKEPKADGKESKRPVNRETGTQVFRYTAAVRPISGSITHVDVRLVGGQECEIFASAQYQTK